MFSASAAGILIPEPLQILGTLDLAAPSGALRGSEPALCDAAVPGRGLQALQGTGDVLEKFLVFTMLDMFTCHPGQRLGRAGPFHGRVVCSSRVGPCNAWREHWCTCVFSRVLLQLRDCNHRPQVEPGVSAGEQLQNTSGHAPRRLRVPGLRRRGFCK